MRSFPHIAWLGMLVVAVHGAVAESPSAPGPALPAPLFSRQTSFSIPFQINPAEPGGEPAAAVELHVSTDRGATWRSHGKSDPAKRGFPFRAASDGEYCFAVRTLDAQGRASPETPLSPELRVVIDTVIPQLNVTTQPGSAGDVAVRWDIFDTALNLESFRIEYQLAGPAERWWRMSTPPLIPDKTTGRCAGGINFVPHVKTGVLNIRAEIADRAGNPAVVKSQVRLPGTPEAPLANEIATVPSPDGLPPRRRAETRWTPEQASQLPWLRVPAVPEVRPAPGATAAPATEPPATPPTMERRFPGPAAPPDRAAPPVAQQTTPPVQRRPTPEELPPPLARRPDANPVKNPPRMLDVGPAGITVGESVEVNRPEEVPAGVPDGPPGDKPRRVNSTRFELEYDVESIGRSGIAKVEVWGTRDGGKTWSSLGVDDDNRSPIAANVPGEGLYGFRVSVLSGSGLGGVAPKAGEQPELWIAVDLTRPTGRLTMVEQGTGEHVGELLLRWEAGDNQLAERPITLSQATKKNGPWTIIASGLENSGKFSWRLDNQIPDQVFIRLEVRDEAGNTLDVVTPEPITIERTVPKVRIRSVRPLAEQGEAIPPGPVLPREPIDPESANMPRRYRLY